MASALDAAHAHGLVHRDVKPQNVLLGDDEGVEAASVGDFGVAHAAFSGSELRPGEMVGTVGNASPEQIRGEPVDHRTDVYALGCLLYECLIGRVPFGGRGSLETLWAHLRDEPPMPTMLRPELPSGIDDVVRRALAKRPEARFGSAGAFAQAVAEAMNGRRSERRAETREPSPLPSGTVTFLLTDVEGSTRLLHELGAEAYAEELLEHRRTIREACSSWGGVEVDTQGDAFFFAFPSAPGALESARSFTTALAPGPIKVRVGIHTGTPHVTSEGYVGADVHFAARVSAAGHGGQVLVSQETYVLLSEQDGEEPLALTSLGAHRLKDIPGPVTLYQLGEGSFPSLKTMANSNLPSPASSFLGREDELYEADALLQETRLLTITGPGGQGKTRLALELARRAREERFSDYEDGVFSCFLSSLRDPSLVLPTIAHALSVLDQPGASAVETLTSQLAGKKMLLLVDNFEHLLPCAHDLADLVAACPGLTLLLTSREVLRLQGEVAYELPPLAEDEGVDFFCERAQIEPSDTIRQICSRLEGLPLALELAAARLRLLSPAQLFERLSQRLDLLKGTREADPRQQTLRATIAWSYDLLSSREQRLFARLSVFQGGCTLEAVEVVCEADLDSLESLLDKSLLRRSDDRFWMLETIREFAGERLEESGEAKELRQHHAQWMLALTLDAEEGIEGSEQQGWMNELGREEGNLRAALSWLEASSQVEAQLELIGRIMTFWFARGNWLEGRRWAESAVARSQGLITKHRAKALYALGAFATELGDHLTARSCDVEALAIFREVGDATGIALALTGLENDASAAEDYAAAIRSYEEAIGWARQAGDRSELALATGNLASAVCEEGDYPRAIDLGTEALEIYRELRREHEIAWMLHSLAYFLFRAGRIDEAVAFGREGLVLARAADTVLIVSWSFVFFAAAGWKLGELGTGAKFAGVADVLHDRYEMTRSDLYREIALGLRAALGDERYQMAHAEGQAMSLDDAVELALQALSDE